MPTDSGSAAAAKAALTTGADYWTTAALPSIGLRSLRTADGPHGLRVQDDTNPDHLGLGRSDPATCFPPAVTLASSWDPDLITEVGRALGREAAAKGVDVVLGPGLNIKRSPLCGRNFEYFSEDPFLAGRMAGAMVSGLQSQGVAACVKHFAANNQETDRMRISADVDERALREIYLRAFELVIRDFSPWTVMSSYNRINGVYASEDPWLLTTVLRGEWGFDGVTISDWGAVHDPVAAVAAGLDLRMPGRPADPRVREAIAGGVLDISALNTVGDRLTLLAERTERGGAGGSPIDLDAHHELTRRVAGQSAVLLHNDGARLPLDPATLTSIAIVGELARTPRYQGAGSSAVNPTRVVTILEAFRSRLGDRTEVRFAPGYPTTDEGDGAALLVEAVETARHADVVVLCLGLPASSEAEGHDRTTIDLPEEQLALVGAVSAVTARVVVALSNGSAVTTFRWRHSVGAIVEFWLTGQAHGDTVADVLLGAVNPSGKLAETIPVRLEDTPAFLDFPGESSHVRYAEGIHVGYRWYDARKVAVDFPFGHGLSYTDFTYSDLTVTAHAVTDPIALTVSLRLDNTGGRDGAEVVQLYVGDRTGLLRMPERELRAFAKLRLSSGAHEQVTFDVPRADLEHFHPVAGWSFSGGPLEVAVGSSSRDIRLRMVLDVPGRPIRVPLSVWSHYRDWAADPVAGPALAAVLETNGGIRGRMADLLSDPVGQDSVLGNPMKTLVEFPGFAVTETELEAILAQLPHNG